MKNSKILLYIILVLLVGLLIFVLTRKEKTFKQVEYVECNKVYNTVDKSYLDTIVHIGLRELGIENVSVAIRPMLKEIEQGDIEIKAYIIGGEGQYLITVSDMQRMEAIQVMAHELIHLQQYEMDRLIRVPGATVFDNIPYYDRDLVLYFDRPWEKEAFVEGVVLEKKLKNILY